MKVLDKIRAEGRNVIFLVPHGWAVDVPAMLMAARGQPMAAMFHSQRNQLIDYLWNAVRRKFGGPCARNDGIKPFISSVRQGTGATCPIRITAPSTVASFLRDPIKATLPAVGWLMKFAVRRSCLCSRCTMAKPAYWIFIFASPWTIWPTPMTYGCAPMEEVENLVGRT